MRQKTVITKLLQRVIEVYFKVRQVLQSATVITNVTSTVCIFTSVFHLLYDSIYFFGDYENAGLVEHLSTTGF